MQKPYKIVETWYSRLLPGADILAPPSVLGKYKIFQSSHPPPPPLSPFPRYFLTPCRLFLYLGDFFLFFFSANPPYNVLSACNMLRPPLVSHACIILQFISQWIFIHILQFVLRATFDFSIPAGVKRVNIVKRASRVTDLDLL